MKDFTKAIQGLNQIAAAELGRSAGRKPVPSDVLASRSKLRWLRKHRRMTGCSLGDAVAAWEKFKAMQARNIAFTKQ